MKVNRNSWHYKLLYKQEMSHYTISRVYGTRMKYILGVASCLYGYVVCIFIASFAIFLSWAVGKTLESSPYHIKVNNSYQIFVDMAIGSLIVIVGVMLVLAILTLCIVAMYYMKNVFIDKSKPVEFIDTSNEKDNL